MVEMDPTYAALIASATLVAKETASEAVKDAYHGLNTLIKRKLGGGRDAETVLDNLDSKPEVWYEPLRDLLETSGLNTDPDVLQAARELLELIGPAQIAVGNQNVQVAGGVNTIVQGDYNAVPSERTENIGRPVAAILAEIQAALRIVEHPHTLTTNTLVPFNMEIWNANKGAVRWAGKDVEDVIQKAYAEMALANALAEQNLGLSYGAGFLNDRYRGHVRAMAENFREAVPLLEVRWTRKFGQVVK